MKLNGIERHMVIAALEHKANALRAEHMLHKGSSHTEGLDSLAAMFERLAERLLANKEET